MPDKSGVKNVFLINENLSNCVIIKNLLYLHFIFIIERYIMDASSTIQPISHGYFQNLFPEIHIQLPKIHFHELFYKIENARLQIVSLRDRAIQQLNTWEERLDTIMPNFPLQVRIDQLVDELEKKFDPLVTFNNWLDSNGHGAWVSKLAQFLCKLPIRAARTIIQQLYLVIKGLVYGTTHPLKALNKAAQMLILLPFELAKPETWSQIGAGMVGSSLGDAAIMGGFLSLIGLGIGGAMIAGGVSIGTLNASLRAKEGECMHAASEYLLDQSQKLLETLVASFYMGIITGAIRKAIREHQTKVPNTKENRQVVQEPKSLNHSAPLELKDQMDKMIATKNLPTYSHLKYHDATLGRNAAVEIVWDQKDLPQLAIRLKEINPQLLLPNDYCGCDIGCIPLEDAFSIISTPTSITATYSVGSNTILWETHHRALSKRYTFLNKYFDNDGFDFAYAHRMLLDINAS